MKYDLKNMAIEEIEALASSLGLETYRARQIAQWVFRHHAVSVDEMTSLSKEIRAKLKEVADISSLAPETIAASRDGSKKYLFKTADGFGVETVLMPEKTHQTLCISFSLIKIDEYLKVILYIRTNCVMMLDKITVTDDSKL
jgi:23S rRNA (adenine2503-C2)-methyltransferase